jgi:hypothetical protein
MNTRRSFFKFLTLELPALGLAAGTGTALAKPTAIAKSITVPKPSGYRCKVLAVPGLVFDQHRNDGSDFADRDTVLLDVPLSMVPRVENNRVALVHPHPITYAATGHVFITRAQIWDGNVILGEEYQGRVMMNGDTLCLRNVHLWIEARALEIARRVLAAHPGLSVPGPLPR